MMIVKGENLKKEIIDLLYWDNRIDASSIKVETDGGKVIVTGNVPTFASREVVVELIQSINGVEAIENRLQITRSNELPTDKVLETYIKESLKLNGDIDESTITVSVGNGTVIVDGTVDALWKKRKVRDIIAPLVGVLDIQDTITVVPTESMQDSHISKVVIGTLTRTVGININRVSVVVKEGKVTLEGSVPNWFLKQYVWGITFFINGVKKVHNNLVVSD
jgi:osmotically-inducible protein OsmY